MEKSCTNCGKPVGPHGAKGYCYNCYRRWRRHGHPGYRVPQTITPCANCGEPIGPHGAEGYCGICYKRWKRHGDPAVVKVVHKRHSLDPEYFAEIATPEQAYWLGFLTADGHITPAAGHGSTLQVELAAYDSGHLLKLARALRSDAPLTGPRQNCLTIRFHSNRLVETLVALGFSSRKSLIVAPPLDKLAGLEPYYWRGLWDGDGTISKKSRDRGGWDIGAVGSLACVDGFASWAREISGSKAQLNNRSSKNPDFWQWRVGGTSKPQLLAEQLRLAGIGFGLDRKQALLEELCAIDFAARRTQVRARLRVQLRAAHNGYLARKKEAAATGLLPLWDRTLT